MCQGDNRRNHSVVGLLGTVLTVVDSGAPRTSAVTPTCKSSLGVKKLSTKVDSVECLDPCPSLSLRSFENATMMLMLCGHPEGETQTLQDFP